MWSSDANGNDSSRANEVYSRMIVKVLVGIVLVAPAMATGVVLTRMAMFAGIAAAVWTRIGDVVLEIMVTAALTRTMAAILMRIAASLKAKLSHKGKVKIDPKGSSYIYI